MITLICTDQASVQFQLVPGEFCSGFREMGVYEFSSLPTGASLYIDDELIEPVNTLDGPRLQWQPGFYAGAVSAEVLDSAGICLSAYRIDVSPDDSKLGADLFQRMLDEIRQFDPALVLGAEAAQAHIGVAGEVSTLLLQYARLRHHSDALLKSLHSVASRPLTRLRYEYQRVPLQRIRRIDPGSARRLMRHPEISAVLRKSPALGARSSPVEVMQSFEDLDNPANRALATSLAAVRLRCSAIANGLRHLAITEREAGARTRLVQRVGRKLIFLEELDARLRGLAKLPPFVTVSRAEVSAAGLTAVSAQPTYARAYRLGWASLRPGVADLDQDESLWLSPTWEIYERWCFIRVVGSLRKLFPRLDWSCRRQPALDVIHYVGKSDGVQIEAALQRTFRSAGNVTAGLCSVSLQLQPDIVVTAYIRGERRMLVLDAKYRTTRKNILDAMRSAHQYQDALRWDGRRPDCTLLLIPRGGGVPWLEDETFHQAHRTGVHILTPGQPASELEGMLSYWIGNSMKDL
jgi:hypothetical protein